MKLNQNSIAAMLYKWFYLTKKLPTNLCPYFWKLVFMFVVIIPYSVLCLPYLIGTIFLGEHADITEWYERIPFGVVFYAVLFMLWVLLSPILLFFITSYAKDGFLMYCMAFGVMFWGIGLIVGFYYGIKYIVKSIKKNKTKHKVDAFDNIIEPEPNILIEFIKAKYNKYCPKIDWI